MLLAYEVLKGITRGLPLEDRGMKRSRFEVLREARMPAILIEGGFMQSARRCQNHLRYGFPQANGPRHRGRHPGLQERG